MSLEKIKRDYSLGCAYQAVAVPSLFKPGKGIMAPPDAAAFNAAAKAMTIINPRGRTLPRPKAEG